MRPREASGGSRASTHQKDGGDHPGDREEEHRPRLSLCAMFYSDYHQAARVKDEGGRGQGDCPTYQPAKLGRKIDPPNSNGRVEE